MPIKWNKQESDTIIEGIKADPSALRSKVQNMCQAGLTHVQLKRNKKRNQLKKLFPTPEKLWKIYSRVIWKYMQLFMSINTLDGMDVSFISRWTDIRAQEAGNNANKVAQNDYETMDKFDLDVTSSWNIWLMWNAVEVFTWFDEIEDQPITKSIDPLAVIPDPQDWNRRDVKRFIWFEERFELWDLRADDEKDGWSLMKTNLIMAGITSVEVDLNKQARDNSQGYNTVIWDDAIADILTVFIKFKWRKYYTKWANSWSLLISIVEIEPRTKAQRKDISRVKFPVVIKRAKPIFWSWFGVSVMDETEQYQDNESILLNLEMILARKNAMWADRYINSKKIDLKSMNGKKPWWRNIPVKLDELENMNNAVWMEPLETNWQMPQLMRQTLKQWLQEETGLSSIAFWVSPEWNQTKAEINSLTKNINQLLSYSNTLMMKEEKLWWELWYEYYVYNLPATSKKYITLTKWQGLSDNFEFKRSDFLLDYPVIVKVVSKSEEESKKNKRFARRSVMIWTVLANLKQGSHAFNEYMRNYMSDWWFTRDEYMQYFDYTPSETRALQWLNLLNAFQEKPNSPETWEDYQSFINIYSLAKESPAKNEIIDEYMNAYIWEQLNNPVPEEMWKVDKMWQAQAWNAVTSEISQDAGSESVWV